MEYKFLNFNVGSDQRKMLSFYMQIKQFVFKKDMWTKQNKKKQSYSHVITSFIKILISLVYLSKKYDILVYRM